MSDASRSDAVETRSVPIGEAFAFVREVKDYAIYMIDPHGFILTWNDGARALKGYEADEAVGMNFASFFTDADRERGRPKQLLAQAAAAGRVKDEAWRVRKDGQQFWADVTITAVHDEAKRLRGFVKVTRDLTERRRAEEALRQSEERMRLLVESVRDYAIFMLDTEGRITTWNRGAERIHGYRSEEVIGKHVSIFYPPDASDARHSEHGIGIAREEDRHEEEGWRVRKNGTRFWANIVLTAIRDPETGALRGFAKVTRDLTERQRMEAMARAAAEQLGEERARAEAAREGLRLRDEFISVAAHELRTPLTALVLKLQGIRRGLDLSSDAQTAGLRAMLTDRLGGALRQVDRLSELVERLLDVSRIVRGALVMKFEETNLTQMVQAVALDFREPAHQASCELRVSAPGDVIGTWDTARLEQVVVNLLSNAIKYGAGKPVDIEVEATDAVARVLVTDRGVGIAPENLDRVFARFQRAAPLMHYGGLGLGLYIAKSIVDAHGGFIRVSSREGAGSTFVVELPWKPNATRTPGHAQDAESIP